MTKTFRSPAWIVGIAGVVLLTVVIWSMWAELDQIARGPGKVIPIGRVQIIQSVDGGVIQKINVREGDLVKRGELMVILEKVKPQAGVDEAMAKVAALKSQMARIDAELFDKPLQFPADILAFSDFTSNQRQLYLKRRAALQGEMEALQSMKKLLQEELDLNLPLLKSGDVARSEIIRMQRTIVDIQGQITTRRSKYLQELQAEYAKTQEDLSTAEQILAQRADALQSTDLVAPTDGIVKNVRLTTVGGVLRPGDEVLQIVPTGEELIVEAQVSPRDIAFVKVGQTASVKFDTYDASIYGSGEGKVSYISPDTLTEQGPNGQQQVYYRVELTADVSKMRPRRANEKIQIQPGMTATVEIETGKSTVFRYLTKPLTKALSDSMTER